MNQLAPKYVVIYGVSYYNSYGGNKPCHYCGREFNGHPSEHKCSLIPKEHLIPWYANKCMICAGSDNVKYDVDADFHYYYGDDPRDDYHRYIHRCPQHNPCGDP